jgi:hypothetical protein
MEEFLSKVDRLNPCLIIGRWPAKGARGDRSAVTHGAGACAAPRNWTSTHNADSPI